MLHSLTLLLANRRYVFSQHCNITPLITYLRAWTRKMQTSNGSLFLKDSNGRLPDVENGERLHIPVMVKEAIHCLEPQGGQIILDMTFGAGGHARSILHQASNITLFALDRDPLAYRIAQQLSQSSTFGLCSTEQYLTKWMDAGRSLFLLLSERKASHRGKIHALLGRFSQAESLLISSGVKPGTLDGVLLDVGCSSMQFDTAERGFSLRKDGPLDMRMDSNRYSDMPTAADVVNALDGQALASILKTYGEERYAKKIASAIIQARSIYPITRTQQLASIVAGAFPAAALYARKDLLERPAHAATKTFQALRIFVNDELHELYVGLQTAEKFLKPGGRLVAISFHSLEDRIIKRFLHGIDMSEKPNQSITHKINQGLKSHEEIEDKDDLTITNSKWTCIQKKVITPQDQDVQENPRGRSAKLRAAIKL